MRTLLLIVCAALSGLGCKDRKSAAPPDARRAPAAPDARPALPEPPPLDAPSLEQQAREAVEDHIGGDLYIVEDEEDGREREFSLVGFGKPREENGVVYQPVELTDGESQVEMLFVLRRDGESLVVEQARIHKIDGVLRE